MRADRVKRFTARSQTRAVGWPSRPRTRPGGAARPGSVHVVGGPWLQVLGRAAGQACGSGFAGFFVFSRFVVLVFRDRAEELLGELGEASRVALELTLEVVGDAFELGR
jgi:hypothetical protein